MMRRISVWIALGLVVVIAAGTAAGVEWNRSDAARAAAVAENDSMTVTGTVSAVKFSDEDNCRITLDAGRSRKILLRVYEAGEGLGGGGTSEVSGLAGGAVSAEAGEAGQSLALLPGMRITVTAEPSLPEKADNPGTFDYSRYLKSEGIYLIGTCTASQITPLGLNRNPFRGFLVHKAAEFRQLFYLSLAERAGEDAAGLFAGMLFGDKSALSSETYESFQKNGTAHILSVSGLHVGIIYAVIMAIFGRRRRSKAAALTSAGALFLMAVLASFSVSVVRAVIMIYIKIAADLLHRRYDLLSAACLTASFFLIRNPMTLYSTGFILSFSAVISLAVAGSGLERMIKCEHPLWLTFRPIVAIQIGMAPLTAHFFNYFSVAAFISNIPVIFLAGIMIPAGFVLSLLFALGGGAALPAAGAIPAAGSAATGAAAGLAALNPATGAAATGAAAGLAALNPAAILASPVSLACAKMSEMLTFFNDFTGAYGALSYSAASPGLVLMAGYYLVFFIIFSEFRAIYPLNPKTGAALALVIALTLTATIAAEGSKPQVVFVDVGQGDCTHIRTPDGKNYLVDGGGSLFSDYDVGAETLRPYLLKNGVDHLDGVFISHMDADHYKGIAGLNEVFRIDRLYIYEGYGQAIADVASLLNLDGEETTVTCLKGGDSLSLGKAVTADIIYPYTVNSLTFEGSGENDNSDFNANCLVMKLNYRGTRILFTGDIAKEQEEELSGRCACDIVKVPHHGSKYSSSEDFVKGLGAKAAVIEVGKNNFGHPAKDVIERYEESGIMVYRTDRDGAVSLRINGTGCRISVQK